MTSNTAPSAKTVWHEAGHATAVYLHGGQLTYVSALPCVERWGGVCAWRHTPDTRAACDPGADAVIVLAGPFVEARYGTSPITAPLGARDELVCAGGLDDERALTPASNECRARTARRWDAANGSPADEDLVREHIDERAASSRDARDLAYWLKARTDALVRSPRFRHLLEHLARVLLRHGHLTGDAATLELQRADAEFDRWQQHGARSSPATWDAA